MYEIQGRSPAEIGDRMLVGNILFDIVINFDAREKGSEGFQRITHDVIRAEGAVGYAPDSELGKGLNTHVMRDNYSRVGHYWRSNSKQEKANDVGYLKGVEASVNIGEWKKKIQDGKKRSAFIRRIPQCGLDILVLRSCRAQVIPLMKRAAAYLRANQGEVLEELIGLLEKAEAGTDEERKKLIELLRKYAPGNIQGFVGRYYENMEYQTRDEIRIYAAIRQIENMGIPNNTEEFAGRVRNHPAYPVVVENIERMVIKLEKDESEKEEESEKAEEFLEETAGSILTSPIREILF